MQEKIQFVTVALVLACLTVPLHAHHSFRAIFDPDQEITLKAVLTKVEWSNPHVFLFADVKNDDGRVATYMIECQATGLLRRSGVNKNSFTLGEPVTLHAWRARHDRDLLCLKDLIFADGRKIEISPDYAAKRIFR